MNYKLLLVTIVTMVNADDGPWVDCPDNYPISTPCSYIPPQRAGEWCYIECKNNANITKILGDLSVKLPADKKKFISIALDDLTEEDLPAQAFAGIQFELISIFGRNVKRIHNQAFAGTGVQKMQFIHAESLTEVVSGADHEWDLFGAIRSQPALDYLFFWHTGISSIPALAIAGLRNLTEINLFNNHIVTIGTGAFDNLPAFKRLRLGYNEATVCIAERAFTVGPAVAPDQRLTIDIRDNAFAAQGLADRTFESIGRPTALYLNGEHFTRLERPIFGQFLSDNPKNVIFDSGFNCTDSGNHWIAEQYPSLWHNLKCQ